MGVHGQSGIRKSSSKTFDKAWEFQRQQENQALRGDMAKLHEYMATKKFEGGLLVDAVIKHMEAQQQEITELKRQLSVCGMKEDYDKFLATQEENEQLKAQTAAMREALDLVVNDTVISRTSFETAEAIEKALSGDLVDYHNPSDIAEIERLKGEIEDLESGGWRRL
jgi:hypothetical protein